MPEPPQDPPTSATVRAIERAKRHPVVVVAASVFAVVTFIVGVTQYAGDALDWLHKKQNPFEQDYKRISALELGVSANYLVRRFGEAQSSVEVCTQIQCRESLEQRNPTMSLYRTSRLEVRAIFSGEGLAWYAVTLLSNQVQPPMKWLGYNLGKLGKATYQSALDVPELEPTGTDMFLGPQSSAYVEVFSGGAPADYEGLMLAWVPFGTSTAGSFDRGTAADMERLNENEFDESVARPFRSRSEPNTFGRFKDDGGDLATLLASAIDVRVLLYAFTSE